MSFYVPVVQVDLYKNGKLFSDFFVVYFKSCICRVLRCVTQQRFALVVRLLQCVMREIFLLCSVASSHAQASESCGCLYRLTLFRQGMQTAWRDCYRIAVPPKVLNFL